MRERCVLGRCIRQRNKTLLSVVRPPSTLEFSTFTNQPAWEGAAPHTSTAWSLCKNFPASSGWEGSADRKLSHTDGRERATPPARLRTGPFPARASTLLRDSGRNPAATDLPAFQHILGNHSPLQSLTPKRRDQNLATRDWKVLETQQGGGEGLSPALLSDSEFLNQFPLCMFVFGLASGLQTQLDLEIENGLGCHSGETWDASIQHHKVSVFVMGTQSHNRNFTTEVRSDHGSMAGSSFCTSLDLWIFSILSF